MVFERMALKSFSWATMGLALAGVASGQDVNTGAAAGANANIGQDNSSAAANANVPGANLDANADANQVGANAGVQSNDTRAGAELNADGTRADAQINADGTRPGVQLNGDRPAASATNNVDVNGRTQLDANVNGSQTRANTNNGQGLNVNANRDAFGVTFDSSVTDGLVIQQALPNSAAARLGLRKGDRIVDFNGRTYSNADGFNTDLDRFNSNSDMPITYERDGRRYTQNFRLSSQNGVRNSRGSYNSGQSHSGEIFHSAGRPIYGDSGSISGGANMDGGYSGQADAGGYSYGGGSVYQASTSHSRHCCNPCGHQHGRRGRHGRAWR